MLLERYTDPRATLLEISSTPTAELAKQMNASLADALAERRLCAQAVLPYVSQKLPTQIDMRQTRAINLNIVDERQYQELQAVAEEPADNDDGSFSMQLIAAQPSDTQASEHKAETPAAQSPPTEPNDRAIQWDIFPGNKGAQRKNVTSLEPVTPPAGEPPPGSLKSADAWWDSLSRTQRISDAPSAPGRGSWERVDRGGCFAPADRDKPK